MKKAGIGILAPFSATISIYPLQITDRAVINLL